MTRETLLGYENKTVHIRFKNKYGDPCEAFGRVKEVSCESFYLRYFGTHERQRILFSNIVALEEVEVRED